MRAKVLRQGKRNGQNGFHEKDGSVQSFKKKTTKQAFLTETSYTHTAFFLTMGDAH